MTDVRPARTDADLEAWAAVVAAVDGVRWSLPEMRYFTSRGRFAYHVALDGGEPAGALVAGVSDLPGRVYVSVRVVPGARRRGLGTLLLGEALPHAERLGRDVLGGEARVDDPGSLAFAARFGFAEWAVEMELVRTLAGDEAEPPLPPGLEVVPLAGRPDLLDSAWEVCRDGYVDLPLGQPLELPREHWLEEDVEGPRVLRESTLVAVEGAVVVAFAGLLGYGVDTSVAENGLTAVRRDRRGEGLGTLLKQVQAARAARCGVRRLVTSTQEGNEAMRAVNERLGYVEQPAWSKLAAPLAVVRARLGSEATGAGDG